VLREVKVPKVGKASVSKVRKDFKAHRALKASRAGRDSVSKVLRDCKAPKAGKVM